MKVFIIGGTGYLGRNLAETLENEFEIVVTSSRKNSHTLHLDLSDLSAFDFSIFGPADVVLVCAAISSPDYCKRYFDNAWNVNVTGTEKVISEVLARSARVIFFSSDVVYGEAVSPVSEDDECFPSGAYARMKHEIEKKYLGEPNFKSIRLSYVFSFEDKFTSYLRHCDSHNEVAEVFGPLDRSVIYLDDVISGVLGLIVKWNDFKHDCINFGGPNNVGRIHIADAVKRAFLKNLEYRKVMPSREFYDGRPPVINMKSPLLSILLGRSPLTLEAALEDEIDKYQDL